LKAGFGKVGYSAPMTPKMSEEKRPWAPCAVEWYRTPIEPKVLKGLHERSDWLGLLQTLSYLALLALTGTAAFLAAGRLPVAIVILLIFVHGTVCGFMINGVHELGHGTVFRTKWLNALFVRILSFLGWINFEIFQASHARHHRYTLHPPDDLEVVLPTRLMVKHFFKQGFANPGGIVHVLKETIRVARGQMRGDWELTLFPESDPTKRRRPAHWARTLLAGHGLILVLSIYFKLWLLPVLITLTPFYGGWLFFLCNNTQHIGLRDNVPDFRLCCRTFTLNPVVRFLYWDMNYHTEHHMYAAVPCYRLGKLHIQARQDADASFQYSAPLPNYPNYPNCPTT